MSDSVLIPVLFVLNYGILAVLYFKLRRIENRVASRHE